MAAEIVIEFSSTDELAREVEKNLSNGGTFARGVRGVGTGEPCQVVLVRPDDGARMSLVASVVMVTDDGVGVAFSDFADVREKLMSFVFVPETSDSEQAALPDAGLTLLADGAGCHDHAKEVAQSPGAAVHPEPVAKKGSGSLHERLRGISVAEQHKIAREGDANERTVLERFYGKTVWEPLLRNPRLSPPEVARIARMGALPKPLIDIIVGNPAWLSQPQVRRALATNPRLTGDQMMRVLRKMPKHELKLVPKQTAYPTAFRAAAQKLLK